MSNRSQRHLGEFAGLDATGVPAYFRKQRSNVSITRQVYNARRFRGRTNPINTTPLYEFYFARSLPVTEQDNAGNWITVPAQVEPYFTRLGGSKIFWNPERNFTNYLLNSGAPANQTTGSLPTGTYILWLEGTGSVTIAAGTGTATGLGTATAAAPLLVTVTVSGTFNITVTGSVTRFQLEGAAAAALPTWPYTKGGTYIPTTGATAARGAHNLRWVPTAAGSGLIGSEMTLLVEYISPATWPMVSANTTMLQVHNGSNTCYALNILAANTALRAQCLVGGVSSGIITATTNVVANTVYRAVLAFSSAGFALAHTGMSSVLMNANTVGTALTEIQIGNNQALGAAWVTPVALLARWDRRLTNAQMIDLVSRV